VEVSAQLESLAPQGGVKRRTDDEGDGDDDDGGGGGGGPDASKVECCVCLDHPPTEPVVTPCAHIGCNECFTSVIDTVGYCPVCRTAMKSDALVRVRCATMDKDGDDDGDDDDEVGAHKSARAPVRAYIPVRVHACAWLRVSVNALGLCVLAYAVCLFACAVKL
jgi:hypothetical protein